MIVNLPKVGAVEFPDNLTSEQYDDLVGRLAEKYDFSIPKPPAGLGTIAKRGFMRSLGELGIAATDIVPAMISTGLGGDKEYAERQMQEAAQARQELEQKYPTRFKSYKDINSPFEFLEYVAETGGELGPTALTSIIPGVGGGVAGGRLAARAATTAIGAERAALAAPIIEKAAESGARKGMYGGIFLGSYAQNAPEIFEGIYRETGNFEAGIAALTGGLSAALDSVLPAKVLNTLGSYGKLKVVEELAKKSGAAPVAWKTIGKEAAETAFSEGLTEGAQEAIGIYAQKLAGSTKDLLSPENIDRFKEAFVKGAVGGGLFGLPGGVTQALRERAEYRKGEAPPEAPTAAEPEVPPTQPTGPTTPALPAPEQMLQLGMEPGKLPAPAIEPVQPPVAEGEAPTITPGALDQIQGATPESLAPEAPEVPAMAINTDTLKSLGINPKSKAAQALVGADLSTPEGVGTFIKTLEDPGFKGKVDEAAYENLLTQLNPEYVEVARVELKGAPSVAKPVKQPSGVSSVVAGQPVTGAAPAGVGAPQPDGMVSPPANVGQPSVGAKAEPSAVIPTPAPAPAPAVSTPKVDVGSVDKAQREADLVAKFSNEDNLFEVAVSLYQQGITSPVEMSAELGVDKPRAAKLINMAEQFDLDVEAEPVSRETQAQTQPKTEPEVEVEPEIPESAYVDNEADNTKIKELDKPSLPPMNKDAKAYFGRADTETALRNIANDLVFQPTAYRNSKMKALDESYFASEKEAAMFRGQGGVHAVNADKWVRENLTPENVAYLDKWIAQYKKEGERSKRYRSKLEKGQKAQTALKQEIAESPVELTTEQELSNYGIKQEARTAKEAKQYARKAIREMEQVDTERYTAEDKALGWRGIGGSDNSFVDTDLDALLSSPEIAALSTSLHPAVEKALKRGNLTRALGLFADSIDNPRLARIAETLASVLGDVKVVYGAERAMYDPETNTIYLPENATDYDLIHEASHAGLSHIIANPSHPVTRQLAKVFEQVKADIDGAYGAKNLQEFVAEVWSNEDFRTQLKEKRSEVPTLSLWDKIIRAVRKFFRMPDRTESTLDQIDRLLDSIVGAPPSSRTGDTLYAQAIHTPNISSKIMSGVDKMMQAHPAMSSQNAVKFIAAMEGAGLSLRRGMQKFLNLSAIGQVGAEVYRRGVFNRELARLLKEGVVEADARKQAKAIAEQAARNPIDFADTVNEMAGYRENLIEKLMPLDKRLQEFSTKPEFAKWTKMVHDHTREDINPEAPASKYANSEKAVLHAQFAKEFNAAFPQGSEGRKLYRDLFGAYKKLFEELQSSLYANLVDVHEVGTPEHKAALGAYEKVIGMIIAKGIDHYAPLYRQGSFWLEYKNKDGELVRELYNSQIERQVARKKLETEGNSDFDEYVRIEGPIARRAPSGTIAAQIIKIMKEGGADDGAVEKFLELIISAMPETSVLKSFNARKGTLGYEENAATAFRNVTNNLVGQLSRMRFSDKLQRLLNDMTEKANGLRGDDNLRAKEVVQELDSRYQFAMKPTIEAWARWASGGAFYFNLAGNVSSALVNVLQTPMVVFPQLGGRYGYTEAFKALMAATKLYSSSGFSRTTTDINGQQVEQQAMLSIENLVNSGKAPQYKVLVQRLKDLGFLQTSTARDALEASNMPGADPSRFKTMAEKTALYSSFLFHHAERMNREVTALAAFDLEMNRLKGEGITGEAAEALAIDKAIRAVEYTHGAGHAESAPSISQSSLGKALTVFKRFAFTMYYMLFDTIRRSLPVPPNATDEQRELAMAARRQLLGIYGMSALFAGVKGMPLYWIAQMAYDAFADDDEDKFDEVMRKYIGEFWFKGPVNYVTNLGIADRVGWTDLIYRDQKGDKADASVLSQFLENIMGAPYAVVNNIFRGQELIAEGQFYRGVEAMLPVALKNPMKAYRYATEDARTLRGDMVGEVNGFNAAMQLLGFAPADLLTKYEENAYIKSKEDATVGQTKKLLKQYYIALNMGDQDRMDAIEEKLYALGDRHPDLGISGDTISRSVKARDAISRDMYQGIEINKKMRNELIDAAEEIYK